MFRQLTLWSIKSKNSIGMLAVRCCSIWKISSIWLKAKEKKVSYLVHELIRCQMCIVLNYSYSLILYVCVCLNAHL